jgi:two-component system sensor histidine kinase ChvG
MNRLITDISDVSRIDAEMAREDVETVDIGRLLKAICGIINDIHRDDTPQIVLHIEPDTVIRKINRKRRGASSEFLISGNESRLSQVINNIVDNGISFSPPDGKITVTCRRLHKPEEVEMTIEDDGPGIDPENFEKVFTRFYTDRPGQEAFGQNSGLGLHISQQIVMAHNGRIWAENREATVLRPDRAGARFVIRLPAV